MITVTTSIFLLHQSELQVRIWQKILQSQGLTAIALPLSTDLRGQLTDMEDSGIPFPNLILLEQNLPTFETLQFCRWMQSRAVTVPIVLLADQTRKVDAFDRENAINAGALDLLPQFDVETIAIEAVNGLRCVAKALRNIRVVNDPLVRSIMELKRDIEAELFQQEAIATPSMPHTPPTSQPSPRSTPAIPPTATTKATPRKYRGRDY